MAHAIDSPSALARRRRCPGSRRLEAAMPPGDTSSDASVSGTHTHWLCEYCLTFNVSPDSMVGTEMEDDEGKFVVDQERADRATHYTDYVRGRMAAMGPGTAMHLEVEVDPGVLVNRAGMAGTADCILVNDNELEVIDYKDGFLHVSPYDNDQTKAYLVGAVNAFGWRQRLSATIVQPRNEEQGMAIIGTDDLTREEVERWITGTAEDLRASDAPDAPALPGEVQCRWCDARGACKERAEWALSAVVFPVVGVEATLEEKVEAIEPLTNFNPEMLTPDQLAQFMDGIPIAREVFKSVEAHVEHMLKQGVPVGDLCLQKKFGNRAWAKPEEEVAKALKGRKLKVADLYDKKLRSPTQILKSKVLTAAQKQWVSDNLIHRPETGVAIKHQADPGPSALPSAPQGMFPSVKSPQGETPAFLQAPNLES